jgi:hypothetical protein
MFESYPNGISMFRYPRRIHFNAFLFLGVSFLFGAGRLSLRRSQPEQAIIYYSQTMRAQSQYRHLHPNILFSSTFFFSLLYPTTDQFCIRLRLLVCQGNIESARHEFE